MAAHRTVSRSRRGRGNRRPRRKSVRRKSRRISNRSRRTKVSRRSKGTRRNRRPRRISNRRGSMAGVDTIDEPVSTLKPVYRDLYNYNDSTLYHTDIDPLGLPLTPEELREVRVHGDCGRYYWEDTENGRPVYRQVRTKTRKDQFGVPGDCTWMSTWYLRGLAKRTTKRVSTAQLLEIERAQRE